MIKELRATLMKSQHNGVINGHTSNSNVGKARLQSANNYGGNRRISSVYSAQNGAQTLRAKNHNRASQRLGTASNTNAFGGFFSPTPVSSKVPESGHKRDRSVANLKYAGESDNVPTQPESIELDTTQVQTMQRAMSVGITGFYKMESNGNNEWISSQVDLHHASPEPRGKSAVRRARFGESEASSNANLIRTQ